MCPVYILNEVCMIGTPSLSTTLNLERRELNSQGSMNKSEYS